ncbi:polysaccharide export protein [bacterium]|nr:polysaccharide export protein [bacterium]
MRKYIIVLLAFSVFSISTGLAQSMQSGLGLPTMETSGRSVRGATLSLEEKLKELDKKKTNLKNLIEYIPIEGTVDEEKYIVGPGDHFTLSIVGGVEEEYQITVGADGTIILPYTVGVSVGDKSLASAKKAIISSLAKVIQENDISVSLTATRLFLVNVVGMVNLPGDQTVSPAQRVFSAIELAGGKLQNGNFSRVKLIRNGLEKSLDLTRFLYEGDLSQNPHLLDGDIIVVPGADISQPSVFIFGAGYSGTVTNIYEDESPMSLIKRVGADRELIDLADIGLIRKGELYSINLFDNPETPMFSGDSIYFKLLPDSVYVGGKVVGGGSKQYIAGASYVTYIAMAGGLSLEGSLSRVKIIRNGKKLRPNKAGMIRRGDAILIGTSPWYVANEAFKSLGSIGTFASAVYVIGFRD